MSRRYSNASRDPREITVKYAGTCAETGRPLKPGDRAIYYPTSGKLYHPESEQAAEYRRYKADRAAGYDY